MSALDQAIIKAYAKDRPAATTAYAPIAASQPTRRAPASSGEAVEQVYRDGSLYRLHASPPAATVPAPHMPQLPPTSPRRHVRRSVLRLLAANERSAAVDAATTARPKVARKVIIRHVSHSAAPPPLGMLRPLAAPPHEPQAELPPETLVEEQENSKPSPIASPAAPQVAPLNFAAEFALPIEVKGPWLHEASVAPMVLVADGLAATRHPAFAQHIVHVDGIAAHTLETWVLERQEHQDGGKNSLDLRAALSPDLAERAAPKIYIEAGHRGAPNRPHAKFRPAEANEESLKPTLEKAVEHDKPQAAPANLADQLPFAEAFEEVLASDLIPLDEPAKPVTATAREKAPIQEPIVAAVEVELPAPTANTTHPVWEVDRFHWPRTCEKLLGEEDGYLATAGDKLLAAVQDGLRVLAITGTRRGEGRSTLALCLARAAARAGIEVAVMDADFRRPQLASKLGLETAFGWQDAALGKIPLSEAAIRSLADGITVMPLESAPGTRRLSLADARVTATIRAAAATFELLILDLGPIGQQEQLAFPHGEACPLDAAIVVRDLRFTSAEESEAVGEMLHAVGIEAVGVAENFVVDEEIPATSV